MSVTSVRPRLEQEIKFFVPLSSRIAFSQWFSLTFTAHPEHARSTICSVYLDTPDFRHAAEKSGSDFEKIKYRIRWYSDLHGNPTDQPAWLEVKQKIGSARSKYRSPLPYSGIELSRLPLESPLWNEMVHHHYPHEFPLRPGPLNAVMELRYLRQRATHAIYPASFCFDTHIRCVRANPSLGFCKLEAQLNEDVFEQKGDSKDVLPPATPIPRFGLRRYAFSKYYRLFLHLQGEDDGL